MCRYGEKSCNNFFFVLLFFIKWWSGALVLAIQKARIYALVVLLMNFFCSSLRGPPNDETVITVFSPSLGLLHFPFCHGIFFSILLHYERNEKNIFHSFSLPPTKAFIKRKLKL